MLFTPNGNTPTLQTLGGTVSEGETGHLELLGIKLVGKLNSFQAKVHTHCQMELGFLPPREFFVVDGLGKNFKDIENDIENDISQGAFKKELYLCDDEGRLLVLDRFRSHRHLRAVAVLVRHHKRLERAVTWVAAEQLIIEVVLALLVQAERVPTHMATNLLGDVDAAGSLPDGLRVAVPRPRDAQLAFMGDRARRRSSHR